MSESKADRSPHAGVEAFNRKPETPPGSQLTLDQQLHSISAPPVELTEEELNKLAIYKDLEGKTVLLDPEVPHNFKWFSGPFHTAPIGSEASPFAGEPKGKVKVAMLGKKFRVTKRNGIASASGIIIAVSSEHEEDRQFIGKSGWWRVTDLSRSTRAKKRK